MCFVLSLKCFSCQRTLQYCCRQNPWINNKSYVYCHYVIFNYHIIGHFYGGHDL